MQINISTNCMVVNNGKTAYVQKINKDNHMIELTKYVYFGGVFIDSYLLKEISKVYSKPKKGQFLSLKLFILLTVKVW